MRATDQPRERVGTGVSAAGGMAMTDLFISATAALIMVLAVARPFEPVPLPVQADFLAFCVPMDETSGDQQQFDVMVHAFGSVPDAAITILEPADLAELPGAFDMKAQPYYSLAVTQAPMGEVVAARCLQQVLFDLTRPYNASLEHLPRRAPDARAIFIASLARPEALNE